MDHSHRFHFVSPMVCTNVFAVDDESLDHGLRSSFGKMATVKPVKPITADRLQRSRDRICKLKARAYAEPVAETAAAIDTRVAAARSRLQTMMTQREEAAMESAPAVLLFRAVPNQPICGVKRARLAAHAQRGRSHTAEGQLRAILCTAEVRTTLFDRMMAMGGVTPALAHLH